MTTLAGKLVDITGKALHGVQFNLAADTPSYGMLTQFSAIRYTNREMPPITTGTNGTFSVNVTRLNGGTVTPAAAYYYIWGPYGMRARLKADTDNTTTWDNVNRASASFSTPTTCAMSGLIVRYTSDSAGITSYPLTVWLDTPNRSGGFLTDGTYVAGGPVSFSSPLGLLGFPLIQSGQYATPSNPFYVAQFPEGNRIRFQVPALASATLLSLAYKAMRDA